MQVEVNRKELHEAVVKCGKLANGRTILPILSNVKLVAAERARR